MSSNLRLAMHNCISFIRFIYKEQLFGNSDGDKKEFLADISSFANSAGGYLFLGIKEDSGVPIELTGLQIENADSEIGRIENVIRDGIEPRIWGIALRSILLQSLRYVLVIQIPRSWALPHMVSYRGHSKFYARNSVGKYPLDITEIRNLFSVSGAVADHIKEFRLERIGAIIAGETPVPLEQAPKVVLHIVPFTAFDPSIKFNLSQIADQSPPMYISAWNHRYNFDGILSYGQFQKSNNIHSYVQFFRNGCIEAVNANLLREREGTRVIPSIAFERELLKALQSYLRIQKEIGVEPPVSIMLTLLDVVGFTMAVNPSRFPWPEIHPIDKKDLLIAEVIAESLELEPSNIMKPIFDSIWNAAGWPKSMNYTADGKWAER